MDLKKYIRSIQDYPKKGILFREITTLIKTTDAFKESIDQIKNISLNNRHGHPWELSKTPIDERIDFLIDSEIGRYLNYKKIYNCLFF